MSTRSLIGIQLNKDTVEYAYCHWDGYPDNNGRILMESYRDIAKIKSLIEKGSFSSLTSTIEQLSCHDNAESCKINIKNYFSKKDICWSDYRYLYTTEKRWKVYDVYKNKIYYLDDLLEELDRE